MNQGMWAAVKSLKEQGNGFSPEPPEKKAALPAL